MLFKMADDKKSSEPTVIFASASEPCCAAKNAKSKKYIAVGVIALLITVLVVIGALVGMKIYTDNNLEVVKYTLQANGVSQNVSVDNNNAITYHVSREGLEAWILQDFDKGIQVTKQIVGGSTQCYVTALNRSLATDASSIPDTTPNTDDATSDHVTYKILPDRIVDLSFLGKKASELCKNIPTYHAVPDCGNVDNSVKVENSSSAVGHRTKRTPAFCATCSGPGVVNCRCICGCCGIVCADYPTSGTVCTWYYNYGTNQWVCTFYYRRLYAIYTMAWPTCTYGGYRYLP